MTIQLYQFPISHYCEKVRWALDYKGLDWQARNLLPGFHIRTTRKLARRSSVPVLVEDGSVCQGSADILSWLDERYPEPALTPADPDLRQQALDWEQRLDGELGVHVRRFAYHTLLDYPQVVRPFFTHQGNWWWRPFLAISFPKLAGLMRQHMSINEEGAEQSRQQIEQTLAELDSIYRQQPFLVGDQFTRADLTAAALIAPMTMPRQYGLPWPDTMPEPLQSWVDGQSHRLAWVARLYQDHR